MRKILPWLIASVLLVVLYPGAGITNADSKDSWPSFHHDSSLSGYTDSEAPDTNAVAWIFDTESDVRSSPAIVNGILYIGALNGEFYALSANTGALIWTFTTGGEIYSSPVVADGKVYFLSNAPDGNVYALNATTGDQVWAQAIGTGPWDWSSPAVDGSSVFIASSNGYLHSLHADTGVFQWSTFIGGKPDGPISVANGKVFSGTHNFNNSTPTLVALDSVTGAVVWTYDYDLYHGGVVGMVNSNGAAVVDADEDGDFEVYFGVYNWSGVDDQAVCLDEATGAEIWTASIGGHSTSTPAVHDGTVFIGSDDGKVYALDAGTGTETWSFQTGGEVWAAPAVADGKVFVGSLDHTLYALEEATGALVWSYYSGSSRMIGSPAVADGKVFVGNENGNVYAFYPITVQKTLVGFSDEDADGLIEVGEKTYFTLSITVTNNDAENPIEGVVVKDRLGGDLQLDDFLLSAGTLSTYTKGKTNKVFLTWEIGDLEPGASQTLDLLISTDINTGTGNGKKEGHQEYTEAGIHILNSGATAKGIFLGEQVSSRSDSISVEVVDPN